MIKGIIIGFVLAVAVMTGGVYYYFASGMAPAAVSDPMMPFEKKMANMALDAHIEKQHLGESPVLADEPDLVDGARIYKMNCADCHGLPGYPSDYKTMMFPVPTQMFEGKGATDDPPSESYWKAANGIRLSGMPSFKTKLTQTQLWQVSELVAHANELPDSAKKILIPDSAGGTETETHPHASAPAAAPVSRRR
jgi:thiosulfate dehydrogenase